MITLVLALQLQEILLDLEVLEVLQLDVIQTNSNVNLHKEIQCKQGILLDLEPRRHVYQ